MAGDQKESGVGTCGTSWRQAEGPGEGVTLSLSVCFCLPLSLSLTLSLPILVIVWVCRLGTCGPRARGGGEHAELAVTEPNTAADHAPMRVRRPAAGPPALPRLRKRLLRPPLLPAWDGLLRHRGTLQRMPPAASVPSAADCKVRRASPCSAGPRPQTSRVPRVQPYPGCKLSIPHHFSP